MDQERWRRLQEIFQAVLKREPEQRRAFLDTACAGESDLRRQVELMLANDIEAERFLETPALPEITVTQTATGTPVGRQLGPYRIVSMLGAGGMGEVYRAHDIKLGRDVALKMLPPEFARDPARLARFRREARTLASLNHPNIAAIYGLVESFDVDCLVLELVEGETLRGPMPIGQALDYARQVAEALEAAHCKDIIHRDLKPANVKVTLHGRVKVLDFGLAKALWGPEQNPVLSQPETGEGFETLAGQIVGTPGYMSPEQARGWDIDKRTDIWAFGCLLYELLTGKRAFSGETTSDTIAAVLEREPDWQALPAATTPKIGGLIRRCLEKDSARRAQSMTEILHVIGEASPPSQGVKRWRLIAGVSAAALAILAFAAISSRPSGTPLQNQWTRLTNLPDSAVQPALSPDGRMITFIRGSGAGSLFATGQIYVKSLPDGEVVQLTRDDHRKISPVFSPDGSLIAYGTRDEPQWDTWIVPLAGGEPRLWLPNSSGLVWTSPRQMLFSEITSGDHMKLVIAGKNRIGERGVFDPPQIFGMVHRSYPSPNGKSVLIVEMLGDWLPCRVVPMDGSSLGRQIGPPAGACTFGGWSPDGKWIYLSSSAGGRGFHIWRQRFPDGKPEQITSGPTEEEGIAVAPDGRSVVTSVGVRQSPVWLHDASGDRQISLEGYAYEPKLTPDGKKLLYRVGTAAATLGFNEPTALWMADTVTGRSESFVPELSVFGPPALGYDVSPDGKAVVIRSHDRNGKSRLWVIPLDRRSPPHQIPNVEGYHPLFAANGEVFFKDTDQGPGKVYRIQEDGTIVQKLEHIGNLRGRSPDGHWLVATLSNDTYAFPLAGGSPIHICKGDFRLKWSPDGRLLFIVVRTSYPWGGGLTYVIPLSPGKMFPDTPPNGFQSHTELRRLPGVRVIDSYDVAPGTTPDVYAYSRETVQRNLYRIPLP